MEKEPLIQVIQEQAPRHPEHHRRGSENPYLLPVAIVLAGALIAGAILVTGFAKTEPQRQIVGAAGNEQPQEPEANPGALRPVSPNEHFIGNPNAPITIVEYSDLECPFCKVFHATMRRVMGEYQASGKVAWVYRHFPLDSLHPKARKEAHATECAAELGGNDKFWQYTNKIFDITPSNNGLDPAELVKVAGELGLNRAAFSACLESGKYNDKISKDAENAIATGGNGTPWTLIVSKSGKIIPINGAQPYENVKGAIEALLK